MSVPPGRRWWEESGGGGGYGAIEAEEIFDKLGSRLPAGLPTYLAVHLQY